MNSSVHYVFVDRFLFLTSHDKYFTGRDRDRMVVGFTTIYAISAYHH